MWAMARALLIPLDLALGSGWWLGMSYGGPAGQPEKLDRNPAHTPRAEECKQ